MLAVKAIYLHDRGMAATAGAGEGAVAAQEGTEAAEAGAEGAEDVAGACLRCFTGETPVQMADGTTKPISEVRAGDRVKSRDPQTGREEAKTITATIKRLAPAVVTVSLTDAKTGKTEALTCTPEHPLFVTGRGWMEAGSLGIGSSLVSRAGPALTVQGVTWKRDTAEQLAARGGVGNMPVYNLTVEGDHTSFVGTTGGGTWVHNANCTVIGRMKDLEQFEDNPNIDTWAKSGRRPVDGEPRVTWPENRRWLQDRIDRGDSFGIASDPETLGKEYVENLPNGNFTYRELQYLGQNGIEPFPLY